MPTYRSDLAGSEQFPGLTPRQLFAGEAAVITDSAPALANMAQHTVAALTATGITPFVSATHKADQMVITSQPVTTGQQCPYYQAGRFNHAALVWPGDLDTLVKRKLACAGTGLSMGHLV
jgi:hypothetical protein